MVKSLHFNNKTLTFSAPKVNGPKIMGIVNVTPNSFSDGGDYFTHKAALTHAYTLIKEGVDILDIGAESTNPKAKPITSEEEIARLLPVVKELRQQVSIPLSVDTFRPETMKVMIDEGVDIINDVTGLNHPDTLPLLAKSKVAICAMHQLGDELGMHQIIAPRYPKGITQSVTNYLLAIVKRCEALEISHKRIILDPGFGFDKSAKDQLTLLKEINQVAKTPYPILIGVSRKRLVGMVTNVPQAKKRLAGNLAGALWAFSQGVDIIRVHEVKATKEAYQFWQAIQTAESSKDTFQHPSESVKRNF